MSTPAARSAGGPVRSGRSLRTRRTGVLGTVALTLLALTACGASGGDATSASDSSGGDELSGSVTVFAAASLTGSFTDLAADFEAAHPGVSVDLNLAGSSDLATQIVEGAPADVFASADAKNMSTVVDAGLADGDPVDFATNMLEIAVPPGDPAGVRDLADLADPDLKVVVCAPAVPCGAATTTVTEAAGVALTPVSEESSVTDVLGKVTSGEADAGLVYVTDIAAAGDAVEGVPFDESTEAVNTYPIVALTDSRESDAAQAFVDYVAGPDGRAVLSAAGFGSP
ncbi:molybdate ABC transporter substrate-binding protein [Frigoribacterium sp. CFBP9030]|uniref:molybdate ABC transporter substrate-binding protein n=1 Tax=Frigoribacterium sp. CFBP9030 TaxID=3096537 RepID=UPI002A6A4A0A|nr:molybdate ABC transporter substrate-binding protein [Frigoribacterium sp. CFBP9030]MDY0892732.1 molybdate ABC transporter substrate-binding protein [Frigoribacterium sp. CFBP9030]